MALVVVVVALAAAVEMHHPTHSLKRLLQKDTKDSFLCPFDFVTSRYSSLVCKYFHLFRLLLT